MRRILGSWALDMERKEHRDILEKGFKRDNTKPTLLESDPNRGSELLRGYSV